MKRLFLFFAFMMGLFSVNAQNKDPEFVQYMHSPWVDSVFNSLSLKEQIGQMIFVELRPSNPSTIVKALDDAQNLGVGGAVLFKSTLPEAAALTNGLQQASKTPMLIAIDGEWGLGMRLDDVASFPYQMALGSLKDNDLIYKMGLEVARQAKRAGLHINLAPTVDVNNNALNPVIGYRSFGEDPKDVAAKGLAYIKGMEDGGIICTAKHFPGHGDTEVDSHADLPLISHDMDRLNAVELAPFKTLIENGATGIMSAHLNVPALTGNSLPTSLSPKVLKELVRDQWGYKGLIFTDGMEMQGISKYYTPGEAARMAVEAGNDILELVRDPKEAVDSIYAAVQKGQISKAQIEESVRRILAIKYYVGLNKFKPTSTWNIVSDVNSPASQLLIRQMTQKTLTGLQNEGNILPLATGKYNKIAVVSLRSDNGGAFYNRFKKYFKADYYTYDFKNSLTKADDILDSLKKYDLVIAEMGGFSTRPGKAQSSDDPKQNYVLEYGVTTNLQHFLDRLTKEHDNTVLAVFGMPYVMNYLPAIKDATAVVFSQGNSSLAQDLMAQAIAGAFDVDGKLPVNTTPYPINTSVGIKGGIRFAFTIGEEVGINSAKLEHMVDSIVYGSIRNGAFPGCQIVIAKDQKVILERSYGYHTFTGQEPVKDEDLFDMASNTKVCAALPAYMELYDQGKIDLDTPISEYLPGLKFEKSNKKDVTLRSQLSHIAGFQPYYPFWSDAMKKGLIRNKPSKKFNVQIDQNLWASEKIYDFVYKKIRDLPLTEPNKMKYSCLGFVLAPRIIQNVTGENFHDFVDENVYGRLGALYTTFNPLTRGGYPLSQIMPTEYDNAFRKSLVHGFVHDEASAVVGGYSSNAGLFSNALGIAELFQMYLNKGTYGGQYFFSPETFDTFNTQYYLQYNNYRAIGFEKATPANKDRKVEDAWPAPSCSPEAFGHSGFTGTYAWADPANGLIYVFLSNRVYPTRNNKAFDKMQARVGIHELAYQLIKEGLPKEATIQEKQPETKAPALFAD